MVSKNQFVIKQNDQWAVLGEGNSKATRVVNTQKEAINIARRIAQNQHSEMRVQNRKGQFSVCNSYGNDKCPPRDKNR